MTLPSTTARLTRESMLYVSWRRSIMIDSGVSTSTWVLAVAIASDRGVRPGGGGRRLDAQKGSEERDHQTDDDTQLEMPELADVECRGPR